MKSTYSIRELQRETTAAVRAAESGALVTITRNEKPVVHVISDERLGGLLETLELAANPEFVAAVKKLRTGKLRFHPVSTL